MGLQCNAMDTVYLSHTLNASQCEKSITSLIVATLHQFLRTHVSLTTLNLGQCGVLSQKPSQGCQWNFFLLKGVASASQHAALCKAQLPTHSMLPGTSVKGSFTCFDLIHLLVLICLIPFDGETPSITSK